MADGADVISICVLWVEVGIAVAVTILPTADNLDACDSKAIMSDDMVELRQKFRTDVKMLMTLEAPAKPFPSSMLTDIIHCWHAPQLVTKSEPAIHEVFMAKAATSVLQFATLC